MVDYSPQRALADRVVRRASEMFVSGLGAAPSLYKGDGDFVTAVDLSIERFIRGALKEESSIPVFGEEQGGEFDASASWVVDPIDGTTNFAAGNPTCAILLSLIVDGQPVVAVTAMPLLNMHISTMQGAPVALNGKDLPALPAHIPAGAQVGLGSIGSPDSVRFPAQLRVDLALQLSESPLRPRITGSVGVDLGFVAQGAFQAAVSFSPHVWDNAAGVLLARNAGAVVTDAYGNEWVPSSPGVVAGTPKAHDIIMNTLSALHKNN